MLRTMLIVALLLPVSLAGDEGQKTDRAEKRARKIIASKDKDGDGKLSADELGVQAFVFEALDKNGDGFVDATELKSNKRRGADRKGRRGGGDFAAKMIERLDKDGDGKLSQQEWPTEARRKFEQVDRNKDGFVDKAELGGGRRGGDGMDREKIKQRAQQIMQRFDKNGDGKITKDELPQPQEGGDKKKGRGPRGIPFEKADKNKDGAVDILEITVLITEDMKRQRGRRGPDPERMKQTLARMDADKDGKITKDEWKGRPQSFARLDANKDGVIAADEIEAMIKQMQQWRGRSGDAMFRRWDSNSDGKITADEWKANKEFFKRFDRNGDGVITADEVTLLRRRRGGRGGPDLRSGKSSAHFLQKFDADGDGSISKKEFTHERRFAEIDANGDGLLSKAELEEAMDKRTRESKLGFFERFDLNNDGKVTREEYTGAAADFEVKDTNNDGVIDKLDRPRK